MEQETESFIKVAPTDQDYNVEVNEVNNDVSDVALSEIVTFLESRLENNNLTPAEKREVFMKFLALMAEKIGHDACLVLEEVVPELYHQRLLNNDAIQKTAVKQRIEAILNSS